MVNSKELKDSGDVKSRYFQLPHPVSMALVIFGMGLLTVCHLKPDAVPYSYLGPLGTLSRYLALEQPTLIKCIWYGANVIHISEACYSLSVSSVKALETTTRVKWFFSVLFFGGLSLTKLIAYKPSRS